MLIRKFEKNLLRDTENLFCGRGMKWFLPLRGTIFKTTHYILSWFFPAHYPKRDRKGSRCGLFEAEHSKGYPNHFLAPERYDEHPLIFIWESFPGFSFMG